MKPSLLFSSKINTVFNLGFIIMFCGYCDSKLKEREGIQESSFGVTAAGKRYKRWGRGWKALRKSDVYLTKDQQDGEIQEILGHRERMFVLRKQVVKVLLGSGYVSFDALSVGTSVWPKMIWSRMVFMPNSAAWPDFRAHTNGETAGGVYRSSDSLTHRGLHGLKGLLQPGWFLHSVMCNSHFQLVKYLGRYLYEINM